MQHLRGGIVALAAALFAVAGCNSEGPPRLRTQWTSPVCQSGAGCCDESELRCSGDPDAELTCSCFKSWRCDSKLDECTQDAPDSPDGGGGAWTCRVDVELERCEKDGSNVPEGLNGWRCTQEGDKVVCQRPLNTPDGSGGWDCSYDNESTVKRCVRRQQLLPPAVPPLVGGTWSGPCTGGAPDVMIVLDRSGSMAWLSGWQSKWEQAQAAVRSVLATYGKRVRFGLMLFPGAPDEDCVAGTVTVPAADNTSAAITAALGTLPGGGTPIAASLANARTYFASSGSSGRDRYVLLVTDGGETCHGDPVQQVQALASARIKTYVVGFGGDVDSVLLDALAHAGGTARSGALGYYEANDLATLSVAMKNIVGQLCGK
ncbi:MAG: VWA domain-containing protein [Myxococcales bacterium]|nr:VWA domain-containing protein [Myxococcales bacterium]